MLRIDGGRLFFIVDGIHGTCLRRLDDFLVEGQQIGSVLYRRYVTLKFEYVGADFHTGAAGDTRIIDRYRFHWILLPDCPLFPRGALLRLAFLMMSPRRAIFVNFPGSFFIEQTLLNRAE